MKWENKNKFSSVDALVETRLADLQTKDFYGLTAVGRHGKVALMDIVRRLDSGLPITLIGDYDVDGIMSVSEFKEIAEKRGWNMTVRLPKRFSEGYGLSTKIVDEINEGIILTVDNGIAAHEAIEKAKKKGLYVIVTDHHLTVKNVDGTDKLPDADIILNPHIENTCDFNDYCGAGIVYKLAEMMYPDDTEFLNKLSTYAAIATIADCVPLIEDNRKIVQKGLEQIVAGPKNSGLIALIAMSESYFRPLLVTKSNGFVERKAPEKCSHVIMKLKTGEYITGYYAQFEKFLNINRKVVLDSDIETWAYEPKGMPLNYYCDETTIGFKLAPMLNAPGRLYDDGAKLSFDLLTFNGPIKEAVAKAINLYSDNEKRKVLVDEGTKQLEAIIKDQNLYNNYPLCICHEGLHEGVIGILAGKLLEKYKVPTIIFTDCNGQLKGSARSNEGLNIKELLDKHSNLIIKYGGHPAAAGLSIRTMDFMEFDRALRNSATIPSGDNVLEYDLIVESDDIVDVVNKLKVLKPFGEMNPKPVVLIRKYELQPDLYNGEFYRVCQEGRSVILNGKKSSAIGFELYAQYKSIVTNPILNEKCLNIVGTLTENHFNGKVTPQIEMIDFKA